MYYYYLDRTWNSLLQHAYYDAPAIPIPKRIIGRARRYHDSTIPPLDFRSNHWASQFNQTEVQNGSRESNAEDSSRLDERDR